MLDAMAVFAMFPTFSKLMKSPTDVFAQKNFSNVNFQIKFLYRYD